MNITSEQLRGTKWAKLAHIPRGITRPAGKLDHVSAMELAKLYTELGSVQRISERLNVSYSIVRARAEAIGIQLQHRAWSAEEDQKLRNYYATSDPKEFSIDRAASQMGRTKYAVAIRASRMGLGDFSRPKVRTTIQRNMELPWGRWTKYPHPRGMAGKKHSPNVIEKLRIANRKNWEHSKATNTGNMSPENRQRSSDLMMERNRNDPRMNPGYTRCRGGRGAGLGDYYFRSGWERNIARYLNFLVKAGQIIRWEYEPDVFWFEKIKRGVRSYKPDFKIFLADGSHYYIEVKGWMDAKSKTKLKRMKKYHPTVKLELIDEKRYVGIKRTCAGLIEGWEGK